MTEVLVAARLLVIQMRGESGGGTVEIVHESLIDRWPTLRRWLDEDQEDAAFLQQLSAAAKQWEAKGRPAGLLWRGDAMEEARRWYSSSARPLSPRDQAFIDAVLSLAHRGRRARRAVLGLAFLVLAAIAGGASIAYMQVRSANAEAKEKQELAEQALAAANEKEHRSGSPPKYELFYPRINPDSGKTPRRSSNLDCNFDDGQPSPPHRPRQ